MAPPRLRRHSREILRRLRAGERLELRPDGPVLIPSEYRPTKPAIKNLINLEYVTAPVPAAPLLGRSAVYGFITPVGLSAFDWATRGAYEDDH